jgi:hypothetical protein
MKLVSLQYLYSIGREWQVLMELSDTRSNIWIDSSSIWRKVSARHRIRQLSVPLVLDGARDHFTHILVRWHHRAVFYPPLLVFVSAYFRSRTSVPHTFRLKKQVSMDDGYSYTAVTCPCTVSFSNH